MSKSIDHNLLVFGFSQKKYAFELYSKADPIWFDKEYKNIYLTYEKYFKQFKDIPPKEVFIEFGEFTAQDITKIDEIYTDALINKGEAGGFAFYVSKLQDRYNLYLIENGYSQIFSNIKQTPVKQLNNKIKQLTNSISNLNKVTTFEQGGISETALKRWEKYKDVEANPDISKGILSKFSELDRHTNGIKESELMVVAGSSGTGKSLFIMNAAINAWLGSNNINTSMDNIKPDGKNVLMISIEMPKEMMERRIDSNLSGVAAYHIRDGNCSAAEKADFKKALKFQVDYEHNYKKLYIIDMARNASIANVEAQYESLLSIFEPDLIVIDYIGIMKPSTVTGIDWIDQGNIAADLHEFSRVYKKPVITAAQLKASNTNGVKNPMDTERVARSKMIGDNTNIMLQIEKTPDFDLSSILKVHLVKNRDGQSGSVLELSKEYWRMRIEDLDNNIM